MGDEQDHRIRLAAFDMVRRLDAIHAGSIPWAEITRGFTVDGENVMLANRPRGIFRPRQMRRGLLSIKTTVPRQGRQQRYDDIASDDGFFLYRFKGDDPADNDNRALREAWEDRTPLIYLRGIAPTLYQAIWPVFVTHWDAGSLSAQVVPGEWDRGTATLSDAADLRRYAVIEAKRRLHQAVFRELVLEAYRGRCALSNLPERRLLHAAHILPDRDERGQPVVSNGISMSVLHHSAYDLNLLGIDPGGVIHLNRDLLSIHDGPTLASLQGLEGGRIRVPDDPGQRPDRDFLAARYEQFRAAA